MSDTRYSPFGDDEDSYHRRPAALGQGRGQNPRANFGHEAPYWDAPQPQARPPASGYAPPHQASWGADGRGHEAGDPYDHHGYFTGHEDRAPMPPPAPRAQADYAARADYDARADYAARAHFAPRGPAPQQGHYGHDEGYYPPQDAPYPEPRLPYASAAPRYGQEAPAAPSRASFSAPPRAPYAAPRAPHLRPEPQLTHPPRAPMGDPRPQPLPPRDFARSAQDHYAALPPQHRLAEPPRAEDHFAPDERMIPRAPRAGGVMQWAGAICTLAIVIGAALWGYELAVRDANGIPVVRAAEGPLRIAPETPGGQISAHQGLAVNAIPAAQSTPTLPEEITLAPQPDAVSAEDVAVPIVEQGSFAQSAGEGTAASLAGASDIAPEAPSDAASEDLAALPSSLPEDMPLSDAEAVERALEAALAEEGQVILASAGDLAPTKTATPSADGVTEIDPATIALGTPLVQLGAFDSDASARAEWANLQNRFGELMSDKALVVEKAKSGGRDFYRLRAHGFASADDTRRFCAAVLAENGSCFPVDQR